MARAFHTDVLLDRAGNACGNALGTLYIDEAATIPAADAFNAASGGTLITTVTTDANGRWRTWWTTPKSYWVRWTDNGDTAYFAGDTSQTAPFATFVSEEYQVFESSADEDVDFTVADIDARDALTTMTNGSFAWVTNIDRVYRYDGTEWKPLADIDYINILDYGAHPDLADNAVPVNAAIADGITRSVYTILVPNPQGIDSALSQSGYGCTTTIDLEGKNFTHFVGRGGVGLPFASHPTANFFNTTNTNPIITMGTTAPGTVPTDRITFENIGFYQPSATAIVGVWVRGLVFRNCGVITFAATPAVSLTNSFWIYGDQSAFYNSNGTTAGVIRCNQVSDANGDVNSVYLVRFQNCTFNGGPWIEYAHTGGTQQPGFYTFIGCDGENGPGDDGLFLRMSGTIGMAVVSWRDCWAFDPVSGGSPWTLVSRDTNGLEHFTFEHSGCSNASRAQIKKRTAGVNGNVVGVYVKGGQLLQVVDSVGALYGAVYGYHLDYKFGSNFVNEDSAGVQPTATQPTADGNGFSGHHRAVRGEGFSRFIQSADGQMWWGSGASGTLDVTLYRSAADTLKTDDAFVAVGNMTAPKFLGAARQILGPFTKVDYTGSGSPVQMDLAGIASPNRYTAIRPGGITGVSVRVSEARTQGTTTVEVTKNGTGTGLTATIDGTNTTFHTATQAETLDTYVAGDEIGVSYTTSGPFLPLGTNDLSVFVEVVE